MATEVGQSSSSSSRSLAPLPSYDQIIAAPVLKSTPEQMKKSISIDLLTACQREVNFLRMIDRKAPVLYEKNVVENAIRRYELFWLPMQVSLILKIDLDETNDFSSFSYFSQ